MCPITKRGIVRVFTVAESDFFPLIDGKSKGRDASACMRSIAIRLSSAPPAATPEVCAWLNLKDGGFLTSDEYFAAHSIFSENYDGIFLPSNTELGEVILPCRVTRTKTHSVV